LPACLECFLNVLPSLLNITIYREFRLISATHSRENEEAEVIGQPRSMASTTVRPWSALELSFCSFFAPHT